MAEWRLYAADYGEGVWGGVGDEWYARMHGGAVPVSVTEHPDGTYKGWIETGDDRPTMICVKQIFEIQFPYGSRAEVEHGRGRVVLLNIEEVPHD